MDDVIDDTTDMVTGFIKMFFYLIIAIPFIIYIICRAISRHNQAKALESSNSISNGDNSIQQI